MFTNNQYVYKQPICLLMVLDLTYFMRMAKYSRIYIYFLLLFYIENPLKSVDLVVRNIVVVN